MRSEFTSTNFGLWFHKPHAFCESQWRWPRGVFVLYRLLMSGYSIFALTHMIVLHERHQHVHSIMAFLTTWTYLVETVFFLLGAILAVVHFARPKHFRSGRLVGVGAEEAIAAEPRHKKNGGVELGKFAYENEGWTKGTSGAVETLGHDGKLGNQGAFIQNGSSKKASTVPFTVTQGTDLKHSKPSHGSELKEGSKARKGDLETGQSWERESIPPSASMPWYVQAYWVISNVIQTFAIIVTIIYFGALYPASGKSGVDLSNLNVHGLNSFMILIDTAVCARPVRLLHVLYPFLYGILYVVFSVIYWSLNKEQNVLYQNVLDWNKPGISSAVSVGVAVIGIPLLQIAHFGLYKLRFYLHEKLYNENYL